MPSVIARPDTGAEPGPDPGPRRRTVASAWSEASTTVPFRRFVARHWVDVVVVAVLLAWLLPLTHRFGGREPGALTLGLLLLVPALAATRVDTLPPRHLVSLLPGAFALLAVGVGPRRGDGLDEAALWLAGGLLYLVVVAWLRRGGRASIAIAVVLVAVLDQFAAAWWSWFGEADPSALMRGTFFWHNPFAAFMVGGGLVGAAVVLLGAGRMRALAAVAFVVAVAGTYYSTSRASLAILGLGCIVALVVSRHRPRRMVSFVGLAGVSVAFTWLLSVRLLMPQGGEVSGLAARGEPLVGNGLARLQYWRGVLNVVRDHPWTGTGADSFGTAGMAVVPGNPQPTTLVHNGVLQAFVDGGLPLGLSVLGCTLVVLFVASRILLASIRSDASSAATFSIAAALGAGALVAHAVLDFDWSYPSLLVLLALLAGVVMSRQPERVEDDSRAIEPTAGPLLQRSRHGVVVVLLVGSVVLGLLASGGHDSAAATGPVPSWRTTVTLGVAAPDGSVSVPGRLRPVSACLDELRAWTLAPASAGQAPPADLMSCTQPAASSDPWVVVSRASAVARSGDLAAADAMAAPAVATMADRRARYALVPVQLAVLAGQSTTAASRLPAAQHLAGEASPDVVADLQRLRLQIAGDLPMTSQGTPGTAAGGRVPAGTGTGTNDVEPNDMGRGER